MINDRHKGWWTETRAQPSLCSTQKVCVLQERIRPGAHKWPLTRGAWGAPSVKLPSSAQVMVSQFVGSSPAWGSVLTAGSLEPVSDSVSPSLSLPLPRLHSVSLSKINTTKT